METNEKTFWEYFIDGATIVAAFLLFMKTSEVMTAIAPATLLGQKGLEVIYGATMASMIEGVTLALHFIKGFKSIPAATGYKWFLFIVSAFCQFMDKFFVITAGSLVQGESATVSFFKFLTYGIPVAIFAGLLMVGNAYVKQNGSRTQRKPFKGVKTMWREFIDGTNGSHPKLPEMQTLNQDVDQEELEEPARKYTKYNSRKSPNLTIEKK